MQIYKIINTINGKIYIGKNSTSDPNYMGSGVVLSKAKSKYGINAFKKIIIEDNIESEEILNEREIYWISKYNATNPEIGYNRAPGGEGNTGKWNGDSLSDEHIDKISKAMKGREIKWKDKLSESRRNSESVKDLYRSQEWRNNISKTLSNKPKSEIHRENLSKSLKSSNKLKESRSSDEFKEKCSAWQKGKKRDESYMKKWLETKAKNNLIRQEKDKKKLLEALEINNYDIEETSKYLGCHKKTVSRKIKKYKIS
jgi:hypothetical protein